MTLSNSNGSKTAHAAMVYTIGASSFMDREDMPAVSHNVDNEPSLSLYTFSNNNIPLVINSNEHFDMTPVTLGFIVKASGKYKLEFEHLQSFGFDVTLVDKAENYKLIDLQKTPEYTFTVTNPTPSVSQEINNRFELRFTYTGHGVTISGLENDPPSSELHLSSGRGYIQAWTSGSPIGSLEVYDALGKQIYRNADVNDHQLRIHVPSRKLYIVKAMVGGEMKIEKTIIK